MSFHLWALASVTICRDTRARDRWCRYAVYCAMPSMTQRGVSSDCEFHCATCVNSCRSSTGRYESPGGVSAVLRTTRTSFGVAHEPPPSGSPRVTPLASETTRSRPEEAGEHVGVAGGVQDGGPRPARAPQGRDGADRVVRLGRERRQPAGVAGRHDDQGVAGHPDRDRPLRPGLVVRRAERLLVGAVARDVPAAAALDHQRHVAVGGRLRVEAAQAVGDGHAGAVHVGDAAELRADRVRDRVPADRGRRVERPLVLAQRQLAQVREQLLLLREHGRLCRVHGGRPCRQVAVLERRLPGREDPEHGRPGGVVPGVRRRCPGPWAARRGCVATAAVVALADGTRRGVDGGDGDPGHRERGHHDRAHDCEDGPAAAPWRGGPQPTTSGAAPVGSGPPYGHTPGPLAGVDPPTPGAP